MLAFGAVVRFRVPSCNSLQTSKRQDAKRQRGVGARGEPDAKLTAISERSVGSAGAKN